MERLIGFDPQLLADSAITGLAVLFLFFILSYLLFNPAKDMLAKRRERVAGDLESAKEAKAKAEALKAEYEEKLATFKKQADSILEDARKRAKDRENEIIEEARAEAMRITDRANNEIELAKKKAMEEVKSNIVDVASIIASKAVNSAMNIEVQDRLVEETLKEIVSNVYGDAYVSVVSEKNNLNVALDEIKAIKDIFVKNDEIVLLLDSPKMDDEEKVSFLKGIFEHHISDDSMGLLLTVIEKKRQAELSAILDYIIDCIKELLLIGKATITTALPLDDAKKERIVEELIKSSRYKSLEAKFIVDESILGGIVIRIGDRVVDSSVKTRIEKMRKMLS